MSRFLGRISPLTALSATVTSLFALVVLHHSLPLLMYIALLTSALILKVRRIDVVWIVAKWILPFVLPLLLIHGVLNATYPAEYWLFDIVPWRKTGFQYGISTSLNIVVLAAVAAFWLHTARDDIVEALIRLRLPLWAIMFASQSIAVSAIVELRVSKTYLAQRARGIRVGPGMLARVKAFPSIVVPVVVGTFLEAEGRVPALVSRGFGCVQMKPLVVRSPRPIESMWIALPVLLLSAAWLLQGVI